MTDNHPLNAGYGLPVWKSCYTCQDYLADPEKRLALAHRFGDKARAEGRDPVAVVDEFMAAAHERHLAGEPLRPGGPTRVTDPALGRLAALLSPGLFGTSVKPPGEGRT
jgi:hypothetical protein